MQGIAADALRPCSTPWSVCTKKCDADHSVVLTFAAKTRKGFTKQFARLFQRSGTNQLANTTPFEITVDEMNRIASLLSVTVDEVARRCGLNVSVSKTVRLARAEVEPPVIGAISAATGEVKFTQAVINDRVKFLVTGDAYLKEAFLVCDLSAIAVSPSKNHQIALVKFLEGGLFLRKISKTSKKGVFDVFPVMEMGVKKLGISITGIYPVLEIGF